MSGSPNNASFLSVTAADSSKQDLRSVATAAGQTDVEKIVYVLEEEKFYVEDVTQQALDDAYAAYLLTHDDATLAKYKTTAKSKIDQWAEQARRRYLSVGEGQAMSYIQKGNEATAYKTAGYPAITGSEYPWIKAEMDATGSSGTVVTDAILAQQVAWIATGATIEKERRTAKLSIDTATTVDSVSTILDNVKSTLESI